MFKENSDKSESKIAKITPFDIPRKLTAQDVALGIGRKVTEEEMEEYLSRLYGKSISLKKAIAKIKKGITKKD